MKERPPSCESATAMRGPETDCMMADTIGMLRVIGDTSPRWKRTSGVFSETLAGMFSAEEYPGTRRYSEKV